MPTKLGQNFLKDETVVKKIIESADLKQDDFVIEIGPGKGILTEELAKKAGKVLAVEIDTKLIDPLKNRFKDQKNIEIINEDVLNINLSEIFSRYAIRDMRYKIVANIPYYITSPIIRLFLEQENQPREMILMVQKEVAERIVSKPGKMSILAVSVQYYADAEILFGVGKDSFDPAPEVDSAVIKITPAQKFTAANKEETKYFFRIVRAGFSAKRKTLINNLSAGLQIEKNDVEEKIKALGLKPTARAQELSVEDWKDLALSFRT
ncbi:MAG TPA: ribosomal RNA small subunit methyltransferase A [Candidatus Moranbacteria bacterium]|nr:ribosomal RNA small subunit methyltransferase A [Candidatus Moranbacteria bacterium]